MNKLMMFTVRDTKASAYLQPFFMPNEATAIRAMSNCLSTPGHQFYVNPEDFGLYCLGEYDVLDGKCTLLDAPEHVVNLVDLISVHENDGE